MPRPALLLAGLLALLGCGVGRAAGPTPAAAPELTQVRQILNLTHEEAAREHPVRITGVVTYCHFPRHGLWSLFVQDETGGVFVSGPGPRVEVGERVTVFGVTNPGEFTPKIHRTRITVLGRAPLPPAVLKRYEDLVAGREDCQWVAIRGIVRSARFAEADHSVLLLDLATGGGRMNVQVLLDDDRVPPDLVDAEVEVSGVSATVLNRRQQLLGVEIYTKGLGRVRIEDPAPAAPFAAPVTPIGNLLQFSRSSHFGHRVQVRGIVTLRDRDGTLYLRDQTGALLVQTRDAAPVARGDEVEVLGFPAAGTFAPYLQDATFRRTGARALPQPRAVRVAQLLDGRLDAELISVEGRLLELARVADEQRLTLQAGDTVFTASLRGGTLAPPQFPAGSTLRLAGICAATADTERPLPKSFHLLVADPADVTLLERPSWWTLTRVLRVLGVAVVIAVVAFGWVLVLWRNNHLLREHRRIQQEILDISGREQQRIAQDLHDGVCQQLGAVAFLSKMLEEDLAVSAPEHAGSVRDISRHLSTAIAQTRTVAKGLFPVKLEENGLESALEELAAQTTKLFKIDCQFTCQRPVAPRDNEAARHLYYVACEAVNNAIKHAHPRRIRIELATDSEMLRLRIINDGTTFTPPAADARGMGLQIMKYRARAVSGTFSIATDPATGCTVTAVCAPPTQTEIETLV